MSGTTEMALWRLQTDTEASVTRKNVARCFPGGLFAQCVFLDFPHLDFTLSLALLQAFEAPSSPRRRYNPATPNTISFLLPSPEYSAARLQG